MIMFRNHNRGGFSRCLPCWRLLPLGEILTFEWQYSCVLTLDALSSSPSIRAAIEHGISKVVEPLSRTEKRRLGLRKPTGLLIEFEVSPQGSVTGISHNCATG